MSDPLPRLQAALGNRYRFECLLGRGGAAAVYLAEDLRHGRRVAVKTLHPDLAATVGAERFLSEIRIAANLSHPHILPVHDSGEVDGTPYYVMPHVQGGSLRTRLHRDGRLAVEEAVRLACQVTEALAYAHGCGIVHRDIKPENILLQAENALVSDFGIARVMQDAGGITITGIVVGSPPYMSPEQASGEPVDGRADIYALGAVLYEMLAGEPAFRGPTAQAILTKSLTEDPPLLRAVRDDVPEGLESAVARAMARNPEDRFQTATEVLRSLQDALDRLHSRPSTEPLREMTSMRVAAQFGVATAGVLAAAYVLTKQLGLPSWTFAFAALLAAVGAALLILTEGQERRRGVTAAWRGVRRRLTRRTWAAGGVLALLVWATVATVLLVRGGRAGEAGRVPRLAVLPFENLGATDDAYFAEGLADEIRAELVSLGELRVIARESSNPYAGSDKSPREIGRELDIDYLLTGTVRWVEEADGQRRVELVPELIDVHTGDIRWQQTLSAAFTDVVRMRPDVALRVADALDVTLGAARREQVAAPHTTNPMAYDSYLRAREEGLRKDDATSLRQAINLFQQAVALDSTLVDAWSGLSHAASGLYIATDDTAVGEQARRAAERALELAPTDGDGYGALVRYYLWVAGDASRAVDAAARGLRTAPGHVDLLVQAALAEQQLGRWDDALAHITEAQRLDPRSGSTAGARGYLLLRLRRHREAHEAYDRALVLDSLNLSLIIQKAMVHLAEGDLDSAKDVIRRAAQRVDEGALALHLASYYDLYWVLSRAQQDLVLRLPQSAFLRERLEWSLVRMQIYALQGNEALARANADSARLIIDARLRADPARNRASFTNLGLALAYLGRREDAIRAGVRGVDVAATDGLAIDATYAEHQLVRIYLLAGEPEKALDHLESLLSVPYYLSRGWLRVDPTFDPLRDRPRFRRLASAAE